MTGENEELGAEQLREIGADVGRRSREQPVGERRHAIDVVQDPLMVLVRHLRQGLRHGRASWASAGDTAPASELEWMVVAFRGAEGVHHASFTGDRDRAT